MKMTAVGVGVEVGVGEKMHCWIAVYPVFLLLVLHLQEKRLLI
jgi:hypothetical protein